MIHRIIITILLYLGRNALGMWLVAQPLVILALTQPSSPVPKQCGHTGNCNILISIVFNLYKVIKNPVTSKNKEKL